VSTFVAKPGFSWQAVAAMSAKIVGHVYSPLERDWTLWGDKVNVPSAVPGSTVADLTPERRCLSRTRITGKWFFLPEQS
jgi:hypothetical protein